MSAVQNRLSGLLTRYKGKLKHYDVNNEMLHGSFYQDHLGKDIRGAPVGGIGIHGHIDSPVGQIVCSALDKLEIFGLPIWFTEFDVSSNNEYVRADDLEVVLWEASCSGNLLPTLQSMA
ncbi:glycosyl hydrolase family 10 protein/carbohydrate-binding domain-containing protein [Forsythia ovata]|uniref:Glycosyl hydrolase family 10 protein/carbohydrate-binding domain-containing protein n=1 Tax=Forsythia ovata TaxID=205694 RepID=A0ABD1U8K1_9LAMI